MNMASGDETPDAPKRPTISEFVEGEEIQNQPDIEIDLGQQVMVDKIKIDFLDRNGRRFIALHTFDPPRWYVHWPSVGLGFLLATLIILLWFFLKWGDSLVAAAEADPTATAAVTLTVDGAEPTYADDDPIVIDCLVTSVAELEVVEEEVPVPVPSIYRITVYGPPMFPTTNHVARWPMTVGDCLEWAESLGLDGICAASPDTPWYDRIRDEMPPILEVEGHGRYLVVDRTATFIHNTIDLWAPDPWPGGTYFCEWREVAEVVQTDTDNE